MIRCLQVSPCVDYGGWPEEKLEKEIRKGIDTK